MPAFIMGNLMQPSRHTHVHKQNKIAQCILSLFPYSLRVSAFWYRTIVTGVCLFPLMIRLVWRAPTEWSGENVADMLSEELLKYAMFSLS